MEQTDTMNFENWFKPQYFSFGSTILINTDVYFKRRILKGFLNKFNIIFKGYGANVRYLLLK